MSSEREDQWLKWRLYQVVTFEPPTEEQKAKGAWGKHRRLGIVCRSATEAWRYVEEKYPSYRIDSVSQLGMVHHVIGESTPSASAGDTTHEAAGVFNNGDPK